MSAHGQIIDWSNGQPLWRRDALRRLLVGPFRPEDEDEVLALLKDAYGLSETGAAAVPLASEHIPSPGNGPAETRLLSLSEIRNVNRLAGDQKLTFAATGVTIIYGDNGAGKSGYTRVLKRVCRARHTEQILADVFVSGPKAPGSATIELLGDDGSPISIKWDDAKSAPSEMAHIAVFDSKCASVHVDSDNQVTFIPYNLDCFERLARLCDQLRDRLTKDQEALKRVVAIPVLLLAEGEGASAQAFLMALGDKTDAELEAASAWTEQDELRRVVLSSLVSDPQARLSQLQDLLASLQPVRERIATAIPHLQRTAVTALHDKKIEMREATEAATVAASSTFSREPLAGVGASTWRAMYEAARAFSEREAYKGEKFPVLSNSANCVLCQQPFSDDAKRRMVRFDKFVEGELTKRAEAVRQDWDGKVAVFRKATAELSALDVRTSLRLKTEHPALHPALTSFLEAAVAIRGAIERAAIGDSQEAINELPAPPLLELDGVLTDLEASIQSTKAAMNDDAAATLRSELDALKSRHVLHTHKAPVRKRLEDLRTLQKLDRAIRACATGAISARGTELIKEHVTAEFQTALLAECKAFGVGNIPLRLMSRSEKGAPSHQLKLDQTSFSGAASAVLSEGEHRALALAAFLAEQKLASRSAPIIVDDPVSSLDHERRNAVLRRLVDEGKTRQVIIFTHDLLFFTDASSVAAEKQVPLSKIAIRRKGTASGVVDPDGDPWIAKILSQRRGWLERQYAKLKGLHGSGADDEYEKEMRYFYDRLRETWERLIEESMFANVVVRFRRGIETKRLAEAVVDDETVTRVFRGMTEISEFTAHDRPSAAGGTLPDPSTIKKHLDDLIACMGAIAVEAKVVKKRRELLEKAPASPPVRMTAQGAEVSH